MSDILDLIKSRRTIKYFLPTFIAWEKLARIVDAGRHAPSSGNIQNWKFVVCVDAGKKQAIAQACYEQYDIAQAFALIVILAEPEKAERYYGIRGERLYSVQNCAAAAMCMMLEAHSMGLGSAWIGAFDEDAIKATLGAPDFTRPQAVIAVGHAKEVPNKPPKYPMEIVCYLNGWRGRIRDGAKYFNDTAAILARKANRTKKAFNKFASETIDKAKEKLDFSRK